MIERTEPGVTWNVPEVQSVGTWDLYEDKSANYLEWPNVIAEGMPSDQLEFNFDSSVMAESNHFLFAVLKHNDPMVAYFISKAVGLSQ